MNIDRRAVLRVGGYGLAASLVPLRFALAAAEIKSLRLIDALSKSSMTWTALDLLRPAVQRNLGCEVVAQTITGHDGFDAVHAVLESAGDETRLLGTGVMATQYAARLMKTDVRLEDLLPIAKLTNGFSGTLFAARQPPDDMGRYCRREDTLAAARRARRRAISPSSWCNARAPLRRGRHARHAGRGVTAISGRARWHRGHLTVASISINRSRLFLRGPAQYDAERHADPPRPRQRQARLHRASASSPPEVDPAPPLARKPSWLPAMNDVLSAAEAGNILLHKGRRS